MGADGRRTHPWFRLSSHALLRGRRFRRRLLRPCPTASLPGRPPSFAHGRRLPDLGGAFEESSGDSGHESAGPGWTARRRGARWAGRSGRVSSAQHGLDDWLWCGLLPRAGDPGFRRLLRRNERRDGRSRRRGHDRLGAERAAVEGRRRARGPLRRPPLAARPLRAGRGDCRHRYGRVPRRAAWGSSAADRETEQASRRCAHRPGAARAIRWRCGACRPCPRIRPHRSHHVRRWSRDDPGDRAHGRPRAGVARFEDFRRRNRSRTDNPRPRGHLLDLPVTAWRVSWEGSSPPWPRLDRPPRWRSRPAIRSNTSERATWSKAPFAPWLLQSSECWRLPPSASAEPR